MHIKPYILNFVFILFLFCLGSAYSISQNVDTDKINDLLVLADVLIENHRTEEDRLKAEKCMDSLFYWCKRYKLKEELGSAYRIKGNYYRFQSENTKAMLFFDSALKILRPINSSEIGVVTNSLSRVYRDLGLFDSALVFYDETIEIRKKETKTQMSLYGINKLICDKSLIYKDMRDYSSALTQLNEAIVFSKSNNCNACLADAHIYATIFYKFMNDCDQALKHALLATKDSSYFMWSQSGYIWEILGNTYLDCFNNYDSAEICLKKAIKNSEDNPVFSVFLGAKLNLGKIYVIKRQLVDARRVIDEIYTYTKEKPSIIENAMALELYGDLYVAKNEPKEAIQYYQAAIPIQLISNNFNAISKLYLKLSKIFKQLNKFEESLSYFQLYKTYEDSVLSKEKYKEFKSIELKYQTREKEARIKDLENEFNIKSLQLKNEKNQKIFISISLILIAVLSTLLVKRNKNKQKMELQQERIKSTKKDLEKEKKILEIEQKLLLAQLNPHFIYNALSSIELYILNNQSFKASEYLTDFANLMRLVLENSRKEFLTIKDEINMLRTYLSLEQVRFNHRFDFELTVDQEINLEDKIPCMFIQPFVENAINHGVSTLETNGQIKIHFSLKGSSIEASILDNGIGRSEILSNYKQYQSQSTKIIIDRISIFKEKFNQAISFNIMDGHEGKGTLVKLIIPIL